MFTQALTFLLLEKQSLASEDGTMLNYIICNFLEDCVLFMGILSLSS